MEARECPICHRPYGVRKRCYHCNHPRKRTGEVRTCAQCGKQFYAAQWQLADVVRRQGTYCSRACVDAAMRIEGRGYTYTRKDGYVYTYYPKHPDANSNGYLMEHRLVAEQKYGRRILPTEHVHHLNGIRNDNRPENLEVIAPGEHAHLSNATGVAKRRALREEVQRLRAEVAEYRRRYGPLKETD